jgi:hypothetical protein
MEELKMAMTEKEIREYTNWMYTEGNAYDCEHCPANEGNFDGKPLKCGQQHCWVEVHCHPEWFTR